jgi:hypothetical protein
MKKPRPTEPKKATKLRRQGDLETVPESRARRETLEKKRGARPVIGDAVATGGSRSQHAMAARAGRQPVLESPGDHPAKRGPRMADDEVKRERAAGAKMKPAAAGGRRKVQATSGRTARAR